MLSVYLLGGVIASVCRWASPSAIPSAIRHVLGFPTSISNTLFNHAGGRLVGEEQDGETWIHKLFHGKQPKVKKTAMRMKV